MPNPPKPIEQKRRAGNPGKRALPSKTALALAPIAEIVPAMPQESLGEIMDQIFLVGSRWLATTDAATVVILREAIVEREELRPLALAGNSAARKELRELDKQILSTLSQLGFDPTSRARLGIAEVKVASTLKTLKQKRRG